MGLFKTITVAGVSYELYPKVASGGGLKFSETEGLCLYLSATPRGLEIYQNALQVKVASGGGLKFSEMDGGIAVDTMYSQLYTYEGKLKVRTEYPIVNSGESLCLKLRQQDLQVDSRGYLGLNLTGIDQFQAGRSASVDSSDNNLFGLTRVTAINSSCIALIPNIVHDDLKGSYFSLPSMSNYNVGYLKFAYENGGLFIPLAKGHSLKSSTNGIMVDPDWVLGLATQYLKVNEDGSLSKK